MTSDRAPATLGIHESLVCVRPLATTSLFRGGYQDNIAQCLFPMSVMVNVLFIIILMQ